MEGVERNLSIIYWLIQMSFENTEEALDIFISSIGGNYFM